MPVFAYTFEPGKLTRPSRIELVGQDDQRIKDMRVFLMGRCLENTRESLDDTTLTTENNFDFMTALAEDLRLFRETDPNNLPLDTHETIGEDQENACATTDKATGVMISEDSDGEFYPIGSDLNPDSLSQIESELSDDVAIIHAVRGGFNYQAYAVEPRPHPSQDRKHTTHISLGYMNPDGKMLTGYTPVVTVLDETHPVRQLVKANKSAAAS